MFKLKAVFLLSLAATAAAGLAFANNVVAIVRWWRMFLAAGGDTAGLAAHAPGCFPWLDWSAVDYSGVTTLIPFLGFACMTVGSLRLLFGRRVRAEIFPFFTGSDQFHIALGLFGTLWGIIVIGFFKLDTVTMADLMQCLHTALFSTLTAVVWVFLFDRPLIRPLFRKLLDESNLATEGEADLNAAVDGLIRRLDAASEAFDRRQKEYERAFETRQREYNEFFVRRIAELEAKTAAAEKRAAEAEEKVHAVAEAVGGWGKRG